MANGAEHKPNRVKGKGNFSEKTNRKRNYIAVDGRESAVIVTQDHLAIMGKETGFFSLSEARTGQIVVPIGKIGCITKNISRILYHSVNSLMTYQ